MGVYFDSTPVLVKKCHIYSCSVEGPRFTLHEIMEQLRDKGSVPLGILNYSFASEQLELAVFHGVDPSEVNALFEKLGVKVKFQ